ncbi:ABC transporter ATP-binding protein [Putridiphycobacter roseus]|uniref:ABC transporter ATP-binding protein n=1 Tax=Putridiphycobacter roseus TaxID=2219161 RepID=A0A2W1MZ15_9FLAO|nr:ABC transporter ATP-binding protein [Putridiphycobacter roseus]PZE17449.1 ABC transporter ATP-binding protein [Putridiphycobacter roseus]
MAKCVIDINHITKVFNPGENEVRALNDVSLKIFEGEFVSLMGASGSGKSTLLNILGCLDQPTSGTYFLDGEEVNGISKAAISRIRNRKFGFVFQAYNLLPKTTALENVELPLLYNSDISSSLRRKKAKEALVSVGLAKRIYHKTNELSGGQQQRVAIARALVNEPKVIFADEPTGNLDSKTSYQIMELFQNLNEKGILIVMVSHEPDIVEMSKRKIILHDGKVIEDDEIINPKNAHELFVAANKK